MAENKDRIADIFLNLINLVFLYNLLIINENSAD